MLLKYVNDFAEVIVCCGCVFEVFGIIRDDVQNDDGIGVVVVGNGFECSGECVCGVHDDFVICSGFFVFGVDRVDCVDDVPRLRRFEIGIVVHMYQGFCLRRSNVFGGIWTRKRQGSGIRRTRF